MSDKVPPDSLIKRSGVWWRSGGCTGEDVGQRTAPEALEHEQISPGRVRREERAHRVGRGKVRQAGEFGV